MVHVSVVCVSVLQQLANISIDGVVVVYRNPHLTQITSGFSQADACQACTKLTMLRRRACLVMLVVLVVRAGIFNDQRPHVSGPHSAICALSRLTNLSSTGLATPLLPHPALTALVSFSALGLIRRISGSSLALISSCSSIRSLKIEAGRRGIAAVAAEHLHYMRSMRHLTSISIALSKGGQAASKSTQQLLQLQLPGLKSFAVGSGDHRLGFSTQQLQDMAAQWPALESLRLSSFSPLQGFAGEGSWRIGLCWFLCNSAGYACLC